MDFWSTAATLDKRKWLILICMAVTAMLTYGATRLTGSRWQATVRFVTAPTSLLTSDEQRPDREQDDPNGEENAAKAQAAVYAALVKSRDLIQPGLKKLGQTRLPFDLLSNINFVATGPRSFELQVLDTNPVRAGQLANALADGLVEKNRLVYTQQAEKVVKLLQDQLRETDAGLVKTRARYEAFRAQHQVVGSQSDDLGIDLSRLQHAREARDEATEKLAEAQARLHESKAELAQMPRTIGVKRMYNASPLVDALDKQLAILESQLTILRSRYTDEKVEVKQAMAARDALDARLERELAKHPTRIVQQPNPAVGRLQIAIAQMQQAASGYRAEISALDATMKSSTDEIKSSGGAFGPLGEMASELTRENQNRSNLADRLQSARMALDMAERQNPLVILDRVNAFNPPVDAKPGRSVKLLILAMLCALLISSGLIITFDSVDRRLKTVQDAELALPALVCAAIPQAQGAVRSLSRVTEEHPMSLNSESYHFLTQYLLDSHGPRIQSLMVLSAKAGQGSTNTITNLGITLAQAGHRVIVVDANIRTPQIHNVFGIANEIGFTDLLSKREGASLERALHSTSVNYLSVIPSGTAPENPWELFRSQNLWELSQQLEGIADFVLFDTPSALAFTDALNLAPVIDAAFLCVRALEPPSGAEQRLIESLKRANADLSMLGVVLSDVPASLLEGYRYYQHYYPSTAHPVSPLSRNAAPVQVHSLIELPVHKNGQTGDVEGENR